VIQFRVPEHLKDRPPFRERVVFKRTTGTKDYQKAAAERDRLFKLWRFFEPQEEAEERKADAAKSASEHYFDQLNAVDRSQDLDVLLAELNGQIQDIDEDASTPLRAKRRAKLVAQRDATRQAIDEGQKSPLELAETRHPYEQTLSTATGRYREELEARGRKKKTVGKLVLAEDRFRKFVGLDARLRLITRATVKKYIRELANQGYAKISIKNDLTYLGGAFRWSQDEGYLAANLVNPFSDQLDVGAPDHQRRQIFSRDQILALLDAGKEDRDLEKAIYMGYFTGMRISEVYSVRRKDIDGVKVWSVAEQGGKTKASTRNVPISAHLEKALTDMKALPANEQGLFWSSTSADALGKRFGRLKSKVLVKLGIKDHKPYVFHSFRHGFSTILHDAGYNELWIADLTGHEKSHLAKTEAGRTYIATVGLARLVDMVDCIPAL